MPGNGSSRRIYLLWSSGAYSSQCYALMRDEITSGNFFFRVFSELHNATVVILATHSCNFNVCCKTKNFEKGYLVSKTEEDVRFQYFSLKIQMSFFDTKILHFMACESE